MAFITILMFEIKGSPITLPSVMRHRIWHQAISISSATCDISILPTQAVLRQPESYILKFIFDRYEITAYSPDSLLLEYSTYLHFRLYLDMFHSSKYTFIAFGTSSACIIYEYKCGIVPFLFRVSPLSVVSTLNLLDFLVLLTYELIYIMEWAKICSAKTFNF